jgi:ubiquinone/menaquinone biosynthesis C-methylase UbiE
MKGLWRRFIVLGFRLLYNELAFLYDPVSWAVSKGYWRNWQRTALSHLPVKGRVLEAGFGPGHLLVDLAEAGLRPFGLDLSPAMLRQARRRLRARSLAVPLCRGNACTLPFVGEAFDAIVVTFPTPFVYAAAWLRELNRTLTPGGRLVVVEVAIFRRGDPVARSLEALYRVTGQRNPSPDLTERLRQTGLVAWRETSQVDGADVGLVLAEKRATDGKP